MPQGSDLRTASGGFEAFLPAFLSTETTPEPWLRRVIEDELAALRTRILESEGWGGGSEQRRAAPLINGPLSPLNGTATGDPFTSLLMATTTLGDADLLQQARAQAERAATDERLESVAAFWRRVQWLLAPATQGDIERLDPVRDCERIFHFVARDFRTELKVFAVLHETRAAVSLPLANFFLNTREFSERGVKRIVDTVLMVCNALEWGFDSARGQACIERINQIHARYAIPNVAFKYVLSGIMFIPVEFNQRFGWRPMTDTERLGWFHAFVKLGRALQIDDLSDDFDTMYRWYRDVSENNAGYAPNKQRLVRDILGQVLARYPKAVRGIVASAFVAGMDDAYLTAANLPKAPHGVEAALRRLFRAAGEAAQRRPLGGHWLQSLLPSSVYPNGYDVTELGVKTRSEGLPSQEAVCGRAGELRSMNEAELEQRNAKGELLLVIDDYVYDLSRFAEHHPGGPATLVRQRGKDASAAFRAAPHSAATWRFMENYRIARFETTEPSSPRERRSVAETEQLAERRSQRLPLPEMTETLEDWARGLLALVNARSAGEEALTLEEVVAQLRAVGG